MDLKVLGSSSHGNCYILENDTEALIIECGVHINDIKKALDFSFAKVSGCLLTHEHNDHCKSLANMLKSGVDVYASNGTFKAIGLDSHHRIKRIIAGTMFEVGNFKIIPFNIQHDCVEPLGFIINHPETGNVLFITDSYYVSNRFRNINNILIEANFSEEIIQKSVESGRIPEFVQDRTYTSHMSIETCLKTLEANDLSQVNNIVLIHLSDGNSHADKFKSAVEKQTGKRVHIADAGLVIENFNKKPF